MAEPETETEAPPQGKFFFENGATYEGEWKILESAVSGSEEEKPRVRHGKGKYTEGEYSYEGDWVDDKMEGTGEFRFANGNSYHGEFKANAYHGHGTFTWSNGTCYTGSWQEGKMHGDGSYKDANGRMWNGTFYNGAGPGLKCVI